MVLAISVKQTTFERPDAKNCKDLDIFLQMNLSLHEAHSL